MQVNISAEQELWLKEMAAASGQSAETLVHRIVHEYIKNNPRKQENDKPQKLTVTKADRAADFLIEYYKTIYKRKFNIDADEQFDKELVVRIFNEIDATTEDHKTTKDTLQKAIIWYIYQHNNTNNEGTVFPYLLRILFGQPWLLKTCIESSSTTNIELLLKAQEMNVTGKELSRAIRRGDIAGIKTDENIQSLLEDTLMKIELAFDSLGYAESGRRLFKNHPKIKELYTSEIPNARYMRKALDFVAELKNNE